MTKASVVQKGLLTPNPKVRLREQVREVLRFRVKRLALRGF